MSQYTENDEWQLETPVKIELNEAKDLSMDITLKRLPRFYQTVIMFPSKVLYILSSAVFLLPVESGEKISLAVTILLAQVVTFQTLTDILPASSKHFPLLGQFTFFMTLHMALVCCFAIFSE